jgi:ABC-type multidrug transport system fused ATPase/permease subunit
MRNIAGTDPAISGTEFGLEVMSIPRIPYDQASAGMKTPGSLMAFDVYVLVAFTILFEILGCVILHASQNWYGPTTKRYQVTSGMCLTAGADIGALIKGKEAAKVGVEQETSTVPPAPPAHLTAQDIVYEVDVKPEPEKKEEEKKEEETGSPKSGNATTTRTSVVDSEAVIPITAREYGQARKGAAQEWVLKRAVGEGSLSLRSTVSSTGPNSIRVDELVAAEAGAVDDLDPPAPGRLRLLSGITATFSPGTMTALMGSSGAGKTTL